METGLSSRLILTIVSILVLTLGSNIAFARCEQRYIPETTVEQLYEIRQWAIVLAFIPMAEKAGYKFKADEYMKDHPNPNLAAFNFGFVTGFDCYSVDVIASYQSYAQVLMTLNYKDPEYFKEFYIREATRYGYLDYLLPLEETIASF